MSEVPLDVAFTVVQHLVRTFASNEARYLSPEYQEAEVRKDFIDKFWIALGWDVNHDQQLNPYEQEVKVEPSVRVGASHRHADYVFYLAPNYRDPRFFVEAKKPAGDIRTAENYFQTIRYGWNGQTPLAVLTDFEQLHVLDSRARPDVNGALQRAVASYHYTDFSIRDKFAEIYWLFSREAVADGSIDKRAAELPRRLKAVRRGLVPGVYKPVDELFLEDLDEFRGELAKTFKAHDSSLNGDTLTELAQRTLDRLVFMRFLEDRGIELTRIVDKFGETGSAWEDFIAASKRLDAIYNGIVFKRHHVLDAPTFSVDEAVFQGICERLASANSPYDFNAIPLHILGSIYERFLGKVIVATEKRVRVEDKPEVRKAGGVYYTPEFVVRYIAEQTVGKLIESKTPEQIASMRFVDIACGSGSFLLGVYDLLLEYHGHYYNKNPTKAKKVDVVQRDGQIYLSLTKKREILVNNIYGVDVDSQAVEVAQLSLYLRLLKEETTVTTHQYSLDFARVAHLKKLLPDLSRNVICGNSLIDRDVLKSDLFAGDEERRLNPMSFEGAFPAVMSKGGFDAVIGNPPYVQIENIPQRERTYFIEKYGEEGKLGKRYDIYQVFVLRALSLLRDGGLFGYILPNTFLMGHSYSILRHRLVDQTNILEVVDLPQGVFHHVVVDNVLLFLRRDRDKRRREASRIQVHKLAPKSAKTRVAQRDWDEHFELEQGKLSEVDAYRINVHTNPGQAALFQRMEKRSVRLGEITESSQGIILYRTQDDAARARYTSDSEKPGWKKLLRGTNIGRYQMKWGGEYVHYGEWLWCARDEKFFTRPKLLLHAMRNKSLARRLVATYDDEQYYNAHNLANIIAKEGSEYSLKYVLGLFNCTLLNYWYKAHFPNVNINPNDFRQLPLKRIDFGSAAEKKVHDEIEQLVDQMLEGKRRVVAATTDRDLTYYSNKIATIDQELDAIIYSLYGLNAADVAAVVALPEGSVAS